MAATSAAMTEMGGLVNPLLERQTTRWAVDARVEPSQIRP
jgi:hypothetical protein